MQGLPGGVGGAVGGTRQETAPPTLGETWRLGVVAPLDVS